jgi:hypothetical protein
MTLFYAMFKDTRDNTKIDKFLIVVHPSHERIYLPLDFTRFADIRSYGGACGKPAVPLQNTVWTLDKTLTKLGCTGLDSSVTHVDDPFSPDEDMIERMYALRPEVFKARTLHSSLH